MISCFLLICSNDEKALKFFSESIPPRHFPTNMTACFFISLCIGFCFLMASLAILLARNDSFF